MDDFARASEELAASPLTAQHRIATLEGLDPAEKILELRICDRRWVPGISSLASSTIWPTA